MTFKQDLINKQKEKLDKFKNNANLIYQRLQKDKIFKRELYRKAIHLSSLWIPLAIFYIPYFLLIYYNIGEILYTFRGDLMERLILNNYGSFDLTFVKGKCATMYASNGRKYIDFVSGIGVNCLGHNYKPLVKALSKQVKKQIHISNYYFSDIGLEFAKK